MNNTYEIAKTTARTLRKNQTSVEKELWGYLRNKNFFDSKFYRQYIIHFSYENLNRFFIADFYCHRNKLIIELDGKIHDFQEDYDKLREYILNKLDYKIIRFNNKDINTNIEMCLKKIKENLIV